MTSNEKTASLSSLLSSFNIFSSANAQDSSAINKLRELDKEVDKYMSHLGRSDFVHNVPVSIYPIRNQLKHVNIISEKLQIIESIQIEVKKGLFGNSEQSAKHAFEQVSSLFHSTHTCLGATIKDALTKPRGESVLRSHDKPTDGAAFVSKTERLVEEVLGQKYFYKITS